MTGRHSPPDFSPIRFLIAGILGVPVLAYLIAGAGEPFLVAPELLQSFSRVMFDAVARGIAKWFQQSRAGQHGNVMGLEA